MYPKNRPLPPEAAGRAMKPLTRKDTEKENEDSTTANIGGITRESSAAMFGHVRNNSCESLSPEQSLQQEMHFKLSPHTSVKATVSALCPNSLDDFPEYGSNNSDATRNTSRSPATSTLPNEAVAHKKGGHAYMSSHVMPPPYEDQFSQFNGGVGEHVHDQMSGYRSSLNPHHLSQHLYNTTVLSENDIGCDRYQLNQTLVPSVAHHLPPSFSYHQHHRNSHQCQLSPHSSGPNPSGLWPSTDTSASHLWLPKYKNNHNKFGPSYSQYGRGKMSQNGLPLNAQKENSKSTNRNEKEIFSKVEEEKECSEVALDKKLSNSDGKKNKKILPCPQNAAKDKILSTTATDTAIVSLEEQEKNEEKEKNEESQQSLLSSWEENAKYVLQQHQHDVSMLMRVILGLLERISSLKKARHSSENIDCNELNKTATFFPPVAAETKATTSLSTQKAPEKELSVFKDQLTELQDVLMKIQKEGFTKQQNCSSLVAGILDLPRLLPLSSVSSAVFEDMMVSLSNFSLVPENELILARGMYSELRALMKTFNFETTCPNLLDLVAMPQTTNSGVGSTYDQFKRKKRNEHNNNNKTKDDCVTECDV